MAAQIAGVFEKGLQEKIANSKVLVVGAGGIGCEILKNLVLSGFLDIEIIDLDTIDVSNLNRQFLFHKEHVGKSKANVARESALSFNPNAKIKAYHDSITTNDYGVHFFQKFSVVLNALDNRAARNHVNRLCLTANIPLIESGTAGYNGQVELIKRGLTQCYECVPKPAQKSFPGCTIRNTPSEPIHCIVWAKHLFNQLFGESNDDEDVSPDTADPEAGDKAGEEALAKEANKEGNVDRVNTRTWAKQCDFDPAKIFNKLFFDDIKYLLSMSDLWKTRKPPMPVEWESLLEPAAGATEEVTENVAQRDQKVLSMFESAKVYAESVGTLKELFAKLPEGDHLTWDKDDKHAMDFVAACANIRAEIFGIARKSRFDIKSMAGNIIPAIATTNAITAGLVVMMAFRVLKEEYSKCNSVYVRLGLNGRNQLFVPESAIVAPNPKCYVCGAKPEVILQVDTKNVTIRELRDDILIKTLNMVSPDVILDGTSVIVISSEEGETDSNNEKKLAELYIVNGCVLKADDFLQNYELTITVLHKDPGREEASFAIVADPDSLKPKELVEVDKVTDAADDQQPSTSSAQNGGPSHAKKARIAVQDSDDDMYIVEDDEEKPSTSGISISSPSEVAAGSSSVLEKRKHTQDTEAPACKKVKVAAELQDEENDGLIIIPDE
ncbi:ubiquitin-activating enzyme E1 [Anopheles darlingi]|uniref:SUMO-activating enzyme subunit n=1 Tax=Anopheles darlingi TaxID=43151 RepID=W5JJ08_ANODA|nr:SUMO-activating enzyme subunit 2 [Anopheles darlingi]XP_049536836.1 SUMO-activating enzyme subunit 2 [Anopheles darlingi]ETN64121.1 ubiquitin-activating enzyme E1 [Anopheles darlingi]